MEGPRIVKKEEFPELIELVDICFPGDKERGGMLYRWPHCYDIEHLENNAIIKKDGKIVSHVGCIPQNVKIGNGEIKVGGISGVATHPDYRGQGLMSILLRYWIARMKEEKIALSDLGGDRQRYGHFGWENAGREWVFSINRRSLGVDGKIEKWEIKKYEGDSKDLDIIIKIHDKEKFGIKRMKWFYEIIMGRSGWERWFWTDGKRFSYLVTGGFPQDRYRDIAEFGGDFDGVKNILHFLFKKYDLENVTIFSPYIHPLNKFFFEISSSWHLRYNRMIKIIDLLLTLKCFLAQMNRRWHRHWEWHHHSEWKFSKMSRSLLSNKKTHAITLSVKDSNENATLVFGRENIKVEPESSKNKLCLTEMDMVRLLFGLVPPTNYFNLGKNGLFLDIVFPLDFYIWHNEGV